MSQLNIDENMKVKIINNDDTRLWRYISVDDFDGLVAFISTNWGLTSFLAQYEDDEGDLITIASGKDLRDALELAKDENRKSLKVFVQSIDSKKPEPKPDVAVNGLNVASNIDAVDEKDAPMKDMKSMLVDFVNNDAVMALVPELFADVVAQIKERNCGLNENEITTLIHSALDNTETYGVILQHPLCINYIALVLPYIAKKMQYQQSLYPHFKSDTIKSWISDLLRLLKQAVSVHGDSLNLDNVVIDIQYPTHTDDGQVIHYGVECDICSKYPIVGDRFKCSVCSDFDLCARCEPSHAEHPLVNFKKSSKSYKVGVFKGLNEIIAKLQSCCTAVENDAATKYDKMAKAGVPLQSVLNQMKLDHAPAGVVARFLEMYVCDNANLERFCICRARLVPTIARNAYKRSSIVYCDQCNAVLCNELIYHCTSEHSDFHKSGYDLCYACAEKQDELKLNDSDTGDKVQESSTNVPSVDISKYEKMVRAGVPLQAVLNQMRYVDRVSADKLVAFEQQFVCDSNLAPLCVCGTRLKAMIAKNCYTNGCVVWCNECRSKFCNELVFHCPTGYNYTQHRRGYDLCYECAAKKQDASTAVNAQTEAQDADADDNEQEELIQMSDMLHIDENAVNDAANDADENDNSGDHASNASDEIIILDEENEVIDVVDDEAQMDAPDVVPDYQYQSELDQIKLIMGINADVMDNFIKTQLDKNKGDVSVVLNQLLNSHSQ